MKKILFALLASMFIAVSLSATPILKYYDDGKTKIKSETHINAEGEKEGKETLFYKNGKKHKIREYHNGELHGKYIEYRKNGNMEKERTFKHGELDGMEKIYYKSGKLRYERLHKDGKLSGLTKKYDKQDRLAFQITFKDGAAREGLCHTYSKSGDKILKMTNPMLERFEKGKKTLCKIYPKEKDKCKK